MKKCLPLFKVPLLCFIVMVILIFPSFSQTLITVTGKVSDEIEKTPLPGVTIAVKGTSSGTITDMDGNYTLKNVNKDATLVFSFIGYNKEEIAIEGRTHVEIFLTPDLEKLNEVVVVGYGTQRKIETTGAIASIKAQDIVQTPVANLAQGLQARVAGVQINQNSAAPGGNISVRIRGVNSINGTSEPLYVIDGVQISNGGGVADVSPLSTINPNDIESMEVLKDAASTSIYGARGANGVVLITTKRGKAGATRVTYDGYYGVQQATKKLDMLNAPQFAALENEVYKTNVYENIETLGEGVDWQDEILRKAKIESHQLSVVGGTEKTKLAFSGNYFVQDGIIINSSFKRYSGRLNIDHEISKWVKAGASITGTYSVNNQIPTGSTSLDGMVSQSIVGAALAAPPTLQPRKEDGSIYPFAEQYNGRYREVVNPLGLASILNKKALKRTLSNFYVDFSLIKGLTYRASFNVDLQSNLTDTYSPRYIIAPVDLNENSGMAGKYNENFLLLLHESILTYTTKFAEDHSVKFTGVFSSQSGNYNINRITVTGFPNDATGNEGLGLGIGRTVSSDRNKDRLDSYMGRLNYGYKDKFFVDLTARYDGSSKFGENHKWGFFPAISAAWRVTEEAFLKNNNILSDFKLRGSYGSTGNAGAISPYQSLALVSSGPSDAATSYIFNHTYTTGISPTRIPNKDLRWEKSTQADIGADLSFARNRVNITIDWYRKITKDLLYEKAMPMSSGYSTITGNYGELENKGWEFAGNIQLLDGPFRWNFSANATLNRNKILSIDGGLTNERFAPNSTFSVLKVGEPLGLFKTYVFDGIYQSGETVLPGSDSRVGGTKVKDLKEDGVINGDDQTITGNPNPDVIYGFSTDFKYRNFDLNVFFSGVQGRDIYNLSRYALENPLGQRNLLAGVSDRWTPANPNNEYVSGFQGGRLPISNRFIEDGSYLRCKNITLGYSLPKIPFVQNVRLYISANNLFTITKYSGYDPEANSYGNSNTIIGVDNLVYPNAKSFLGGVQLSF